MSAPMSASKPPASHAPRIIAGVCTSFATTYELMNIPEPIMPPITTMVASKIPRRAVRPEGASADSGLPEEECRSCELGGTEASGWRSTNFRAQVASANLSSRGFRAKHRLACLNFYLRGLRTFQLLLKAQNSNHNGAII